MGGSAANDASCADGVESHECAGATAFCGAAAQTLWSRARCSLWCQSERTASIASSNADAANEGASEADSRANANAFAAHYGATAAADDRSADTDDASCADGVGRSHKSAAAKTRWCQSEHTASIASSNADAADSRADANAFAADADHRAIGGEQSQA